MTGLPQPGAPVDGFLGTLCRDLKSATSRSAGFMRHLALAATMQLKEAPLNRRDAMNAEPDHFQSPETGQTGGWNWSCARRG
jgi:hypothetical protein